VSKDKPRVAPAPAPEPPPPPPPVQEPDPGDVVGKKRRSAMMPTAAIIATILSKAIGGGRETLG
jgi:hypothetical protein